MLYDRPFQTLRQHGNKVQLPTFDLICELSIQRANHQGSGYAQENRPSHSLLIQ